MKIKCSVNFYIEKRNDKETGELIIDNVPIHLYFSFDGKRLQYFTGYRIDSNKWNIQEQKVKRNNFNKDGISATEINDHLEDIRKCAKDIYKESKALRQFPSLQFIRDELRNRLGEVDKNQQSFFDLFEKFIEEESQSRTWTQGTITKFRTNYKHLKQFQESKRFRIEFSNIDETFFNNYVSYQRDVLNHRNTTISKNLRIFKWYMNWATKNGHNKNLSYKNYSPDLKGTTRSQKIIFLNWDELMMLYELSIPKKYLEQVRDVFCFCCFTGLRYSDVFNLKRSNVKPDHIEFITIKTEDSLIIDLNDFSRAILDKYKEVPFKGNKCLPVISNQKMNEYLKELGQFAELNQAETIIYYKGSQRIEETFQKWELLSTHVGRKTFVSNALFFNIPAEVVMSWTGHKDHKVLENYYKIIAPQKRREMNKMNKGNKND
ncbi:MAG: site-specific integrase [Bacteroidota bacterium]